MQMKKNIEKIRNQHKKFLSFFLNLSIFIISKKGNIFSSGTTTTTSAQRLAQEEGEREKKNRIEIEDDVEKEKFRR